MTVTSWKASTAGSENVKSSHQFLARFHRLRWIHPAEYFFPPLTIHCCEFAHELVARFPFCVFAGANAEREQRGDDPNGNVGRGNEKHKRKTVSKPNECPLSEQVQASQRNAGILPDDVEQASQPLTLRAGARATA